MRQTPHRAAHSRKGSARAKHSAYAIHADFGNLLAHRTRSLRAQKVRPQSRQSQRCSPFRPRPFLTMAMEPHRGQQDTSQAPADASSKRAVRMTPRTASIALRRSVADMDSIPSLKYLSSSSAFTCAPINSFADCIIAQCNHSYVNNGLTEPSEIRQLLGTLMYISSKEADVRTVYAPQKNQSRKSRQTDCTVHDVGFRIAPQLAEVRRVYEHDAKGQDGGKTGRHVAPHVRRGHWHGYWTGPRENPTGLEIKWVAPTIVNGSRGELEGTVHEVGDRDGRYTLKSTQRECGRAAEQLNGAGRSEEQARDGKSDR